MKKTHKTYDYYQRYTKDKDSSVNFYINNYLNKTQSLFKYWDLPDSIPSTELENILQTNGSCIITEVDGILYALTGSAGGEVDVYGNSTKYVVSNPALRNITKPFTIGEDCVLIKNDYKALGLLPIIGKYAVLLTDSEISLNMVAVLSRITMLISAGDTQSVESAEVFMNKITQGDFSIIAENAFFEGVKMQTGNSTNTNQINHLVELVQYYKGSLLNELGLNANYNMKRERLNTQEVMLNVDVLLPLVENMLEERRTALELINEKYGTKIIVDLDSAWKSTLEVNDHLTEAVDTVTETEAEHLEQAGADDADDADDADNADDADETDEADDADDADDADETDDADEDEDQ